MKKQAVEILALAKQLMAGNRQIIAIFPGEHPGHPYMFYYLENGFVWYTMGGNQRSNQGTLEDFIAKVQAGRLRAKFVENGVVVDHPPRIIVAGFQYDTIYDAATETGNEGYTVGRTEIWYGQDQFMREAGMGYDWLEKKGLRPNPKELGLTHVFLGRINESNPSNVFRMMQGEMWSPEGEARTMIRRKGLGHTSMSVGDIIRVGGKTLFVDRMGFKDITDTGKEFQAKYPDGEPDAQQKKVWREQAEKRRRHEGIRPRK